MSETNTARDFYEMTAKVLIRGFIIGAVLMLVWFGMIAGLGKWAHSVHSIWFDITWREFQVMNYAGMGLFKLALHAFFLIPWIAIQLVLRKK